MKVVTAEQGMILEMNIWEMEYAWDYAKKTTSDDPKIIAKYETRIENDYLASLEKQGLSDEKIEEITSHEYGMIRPITKPGMMILGIGFLCAFVTGLFACKWMISLVKRAQLKYFSFILLPCRTYGNCSCHDVMTENRKYDFLGGEVLLVNKPLNWTSFDVVNKLRYTIKHRIGVKKIKVGHAGTLDPLADGLLIICTGKQTKSIEQYMGLEKTYSGIIRLGGTTPSYDLETEIDKTFPTDHISEEDIRKASSEMTGRNGSISTHIFSQKSAG